MELLQETIQHLLDEEHSNEITMATVAEGWRGMGMCSHISKGLGPNFPWQMALWAPGVMARGLCVLPVLLLGSQAAQCTQCSQFQGMLCSSWASSPPMEPES